MHIFFRCRLAHLDYKEMASLDYKEDARDLHAFKELRFFLSHHVPLEIRCSVSRLELPLITDYLIGGTHLSTGVSGVQKLQQQQQKLHGSMQTIDGEKGVWGCDSMAEDMNITVKRIMAEPELVATCQVFADGQPLHAVPMRYNCTVNGTYSYYRYTA